MDFKTFCEDYGGAMELLNTDVQISESLAYHLERKIPLC